MIVTNRRVKQKDIANALDISRERVHHIITVHLGYRKVLARWVPRQLTVEMKAQRKTICTQLLEDSLMTASVFCGASSLVTSLGCITIREQDAVSSPEEVQSRRISSKGFADNILGHGRYRPY